MTYHRQLSKMSKNMTLLSRCENQRYRRKWRQWRYRGVASCAAKQRRRGAGGRVSSGQRRRIAENG